MEQNFFTSDDEKVVAWFQFSYRSLKDFAISWEWFNPKGELYHRGVINMEAGNYQKYRTWYWISIKKRFSVLNFPGEWKVRIFVYDKLLTEKNFFVINLENE